MNLSSVLFLLFGGYALCSTINNVRLVDHTSYAIEVITKTVNIVEERCWCNLKLPEYVFQLNESVLVTPYRGSLTYSNGFVSSIQHVDIMQSTVQQVWAFNANAESTHTVTVRGTLRMHDVAIGFDVVGHLEGDDRVYRYTALYVQPLLSFAFSMIKDVNTDALSVTVVGSIQTTALRIAEFRPKDTTSDVFAQTFDPTNVTSTGILSWGPEVFQPIAYELATHEIPFPSMCYNCAA